MAEKLAVYKKKKGGKLIKQKSDCRLDMNVAYALMNRIKSGKTVYPNNELIPVPYKGEDGEEIIEYVSSGTIRSWCTRENVIPETGEKLKDFLEKVRKEVKLQKQEERRSEMLDNFEKAFLRTSNLRTSQPVRNMFGQLIKDHKGNIVRKENHNLLRIKMDTAKYVTERLSPDRWGKVEKTENKHLIFSLAELRKARDNKEDETQQ